jgi:hypothetical protein
LQNVSKCPIKNPNSHPLQKTREKQKEKKEKDTCWASRFWSKNHYWAFENPLIYWNKLVQETQPVLKIDPALLTHPYTYFKATFVVLFTFLAAIQFCFHKESWFGTINLNLGLIDSSQENWFKQIHIWANTKSPTQLSIQDGPGQIIPKILG